MYPAQIQKYKQQKILPNNRLSVTKYNTAAYTV